ncbi:K7_03404p [Saccharomyces cerevisiae Kyokai no. 7]|uniref:K7_03404p n=1 Tax=Saccharomyces cerevisiae (strain Kyokai no. 7 / NBRC 101557) TaxID=721032 RepID=G2WFY8_YEASK|nr:K7_03404p [Saccharomyces cerevisiae Kyokai no. 7]
MQIFWLQNQPKGKGKLAKASYTLVKRKAFCFACFSERKKKSKIYGKKKAQEQENVLKNNTYLFICFFSGGRIIGSKSKKKKSSNLSSKWFTIEPLGNIFVKQSRLSIPRKETSL